MKSAKYKPECDTCVMHLPLNHKCSALCEDANDKNGKCKFYKSTSEYTLEYNKNVEGLVPERIIDED